MADFIKNTIKNDEHDDCFCPFFLDNLAVGLNFFFTLQDKHNIRTLLEHIKCICTGCETGQKSNLFYLFLMLVLLNYIFSDNADVYCLYMRS